MKKVLRRFLREWWEPFTLAAAYLVGAGVAGVMFHTSFNSWSDQGIIYGITVGIWFVVELIGRTRQALKEDHE